MNPIGLRRWPWWAAALLLAAAGDGVLAQRGIAQLRERFETDARIMHRLLSQRASQHDAVLASLNLFHTEAARDGREQRLSALYPQLLAVAQRTNVDPWSSNTSLEDTTSRLDRAWQASGTDGRAVTAAFDAARGRYWLVHAATPMSHALLVDLRAMVPWADWPGGNSADAAARATGTRVSLEHAGQRWRLQDAPLWDSRWRLSFRKHLATDSQPFDLVAEQCLGWGDLPWFPILLWTLFSGAATAAVATVLRQRRDRERGELLRRMERVSKLNAMGELAAGMAHELNQPLTAVLANTQAATRLLTETPPDLDAARPAMQRAAEQARRAADVLARLRGAVAQPDAATANRPVELVAVARRALFLIETECRSLGVIAQITGESALTACADPVALEQVLHNLLGNALTALAQVPADQRSLQLRLECNDDHAILDVVDSGPGLSPEVLPRVFEPFFTTRRAADGAATAGGMGLGLSLCESLLQRMGGKIDARNLPPRGAAFRVTLPLVNQTQKVPDAR